MTKEIVRLFAGRDVDMITVVSLILTNAKDNQPTLQKKRTTLTPEYLNDLDSRIDGVVKTYFGVDNAKQLREQTQLVYSLGATIYKGVSDMKRQISATFSDNKTRMNEVLKQLGYTSFFKDAQQREVEPLINLLFLFSRNMTPELQAELVKDGTPEEDITAIMGYAQTLRDANVSQEVLKSTRKVATAEAVKAYNGIYTEVMNKISKLARVFFPEDTKKQQLFSYTTLLKTVNPNYNKKKEMPKEEVA